METKNKVNIEHISEGQIISEQEWKDIYARYTLNLNYRIAQHRLGKTNMAFLSGDSNKHLMDIVNQYNLLDGEHMLCSISRVSDVDYLDFMYVAFFVKTKEFLK